MKVPEPRKLKSGNYFIQLRLGGESIPITAPTAKECTKQAQFVKAEYQAGKRAKQFKSDITLGEAVDNLIAERKTARTLDARSVQQYEDIRRLRYQSIVDIQLANLTPEQWHKATVNELNLPSRKGGLISVKTVKDAHALFSAAIKKYRPDFNTDYTFPEIQRKFYDLIPPEKIWQAVYGTDIELPVLLAMWLSFTASEIRGLTKSRSIKGDQIYVLETVVQINGEATRRERAKEKDRIRVLDLPQYLKDLIDKVEGDEIETRTPRALNARFNKVLEKNGLPHMRFHDLRKVNTSMQITLGIPKTVTQQRNGWSTGDMIDRVYAQTFDQQRKQADQVIDNHMNQILERIQSHKNGMITVYEGTLNTKMLTKTLTL